MYLIGKRRNKIGNYICDTYNCSLNGTLVKLPILPRRILILNGNHKQLRDRKGNAAHQQTTNFIYMITRTKISRRTDRGTFEISATQYSGFENILLRT